MGIHKSWNIQIITRLQTYMRCHASFGIDSNTQISRVKYTALSSQALTRHSIQSSKLSCAASVGCETRQSTYISKRNRDTDSRTHVTHRDTDFHKDKSFKTAWRRPFWGCETRQPTAVKTWNTQSTRLQSQSWLHLPRRWESCWLHLYRLWESSQWVRSNRNLKSTKKTHHTVSGVDHWSRRLQISSKAA